jgi:hypothetical protein
VELGAGSRTQIPAIISQILIITGSIYEKNWDNFQKICPICPWDVLDILNSSHPDMKYRTGISFQNHSTEKLI